MLDPRRGLQAGGVCANPDCQNAMLPNERVGVREDGGVICSSCRRREERKLGTDPRQVNFQHRWRHGHDPNDPDTVKESPWLYLNLDQSETPESEPNQRAALTGGPETPFPCGKCGAKLHIAGDRSVADILEPIGYQPEPGKLPPTERVVVLACPNDSQDDPHPVTQFRESFLRIAMNRRA